MFFTKDNENLIKLEKYESIITDFYQFIAQIKGGECVLGDSNFEFHALEKLKDQSRDTLNQILMLIQRTAEESYMKAFPENQMQIFGSD